MRVVVTPCVVAAVLLAVAAGATRAWPAPAHGHGIATPDTDPAWSPDGTTIAFRRGTSVRVVTADGRREWTAVRRGSLTWLPGGRAGVDTPGGVFVADAHGRHRSLVARGDAPVWSPDGSRVVVGRDFEPTASEYLVVVGARGERRIPQRCPGCSVMDGDPVWSPDGTRVAFTRSTDGRGRQTDELDVVRADGTGLRRVSGLTSAVRWSPDGTRLAGTQGDRRGVPHVAIVRVSDGRTTAIGARGSGGAWSPDGSQLAFVTLRGAVVVATRDGRPLRRLPGGGGRPCIASASPCVGPAWSPDGTRILFTSDRWIVVARADGSRFHRIARGTDPSWSPDGTSVVYAGFACGADQGIHVAAPTGPRRLTDHCTIRGDVGADRIRGTGGDDTIAVLGGGRDVVSCGAGRDVVRADRSDVVARDCEVVSRPR